MAYRRRTRSRRRRAPTRRRRSTYSRSSSRRPMRRRAATSRPRKVTTRFELAQANPFHSNALGAKIPDANSIPSCAFQTTGNYLMPTDVNGVVARAYRPNSACERIGTASSTANSWTWNGDYTAGIVANGKQTSITGNFALVRPVAHGVRLTCPLSPNTVTGNVHVCVFSAPLFGESGWNSVLPKSFDEMAVQPIYKKFPLAAICAKSVTVINRTIDFSSQRYYDPASIVAANAAQMEFQTTGWAIIIVAVEAANPEKGVVAVEQITHFEGAPLTTGLSIASSAAPYNAGVLARTTNGVNSRDDIIESTNQDENSIAAESGFFRGMQDRANEYLAEATSYMAGQAYGAGRQAVDIGLGALGMWGGNRAYVNRPRIMGAFN